MRSGGAKAKGSQWERDVCKALSLWLSGGELDDCFWRSAMSGGRATIGLKDGLERKAQTGDISAIRGAGEALLSIFTIECKFYKDLQVIQGITKDTGFLREFWNQTEKVAKRTSRQPLLIARQNMMPPFVLIPEHAISFLGLSLDNVTATLPRWQAHMLLWDCFLLEAKPPDAGLIIPKQRVRL